MGYARRRNDLRNNRSISNHVNECNLYHELGAQTDLVAALCSEVWQRRNRSSFRLLVKAYLPDIVNDFINEHSDLVERLYSCFNGQPEAEYRVTTDMVMLALGIVAECKSSQKAAYLSRTCLLDSNSPTSVNSPHLTPFTQTTTTTSNGRSQQCHRHELVFGSFRTPASHFAMPQPRSADKVRSLVGGRAQSQGQRRRSRALFSVYGIVLWD